MSQSKIRPIFFGFDTSEPESWIHLNLEDKSSAIEQLIKVTIYIKHVKPKFQRKKYKALCYSYF
jgi:hypothetical protein